MTLKHKYLIGMLLGFLIFHLLFLNTPFVNLEYTVRLALEGLANGGYGHELKYYFMTMANPLGYHYITYFFQEIFQLELSYWTLRIPSLISPFLLIFGGYLVMKSTKIKEEIFLEWTLLCLVCPLIWVYSGRATSDSLPMGLLYLALGLFCHEKKHFFWGILGAICLGLSFIVKYHTFLFGLGFFYIFYKNYKRLNFKVLLYACIPIFMGVFYLVMIYSKYNFWVTHDIFKKMLRFEGNNFFKSFPLYCFYTIGLLGPFGIVPFVKSLKRGFNVHLFCLIFFIVFGPSLYLFNSIGEMNFGALDYYLGPYFILMIKFIGVYLFGYLIVDIFLEYKKGSSMSEFIILTVVPTFLILSFTRPAQRYLIFILPALYSYLLITTQYTMRFKKFLLVSTGLIFISLNIVTISFQISQGIASENMAHWIEKQGLKEFTRAGAINPHAGYIFNKSKSNIKKMYQVSESFRNNPLHKEDLIVFGKRIKTYYLHKIND